MSDESDIRGLVETELATVAEGARREWLRGMLVSPRRLQLEWGYGRPGERLECWLVGQSPDGRVRLVYCERGFGPTYPWGFVNADDDYMGMDCQWHASLEHAAIGAGLLTAPPGYEVP